VTEISHLYSLRDFWRHFGLCRAAAHSDCCFIAPCTNILTYLLTYLLTTTIDTVLLLLWVHTRSTHIKLIFRCVISMTDHPRSSVAYYCMSVVSCLSVCQCQTITFVSLEVRRSHLHIRYISRKLGQVRIYMKVIGSRSRSREQKGRKSLFPQCQTSIGHSSSSIKHKAIRFACSMGFSGMVDRILWPPSLSRDRKWPRVTKCTHLRVAGIRLEAVLFIIC